MPFAYYGAKHRLAKKYPRPHHPVIIEPFAGSAAYAVHHAASIERAILYDLDPSIVEAWDRLRHPGALKELDKAINQERTESILIAGLAAETTRYANRTITDRMRREWPNVRARIAATLPHLERFTIIEGTYQDAPDIEATWHIDPPYQAHGTHMANAGRRYMFGESTIDFDHLGVWCQARRGQVMVCEQSPAEWLPFHPFAQTSTTNGNRQELIWRNDFEQPALW